MTEQEQSMLKRSLVIDKKIRVANLYFVYLVSFSIEELRIGVSHKLESSVMSLPLVWWTFGLFEWLHIFLREGDACLDFMFTFSKFKLILSLFYEQYFPQWD